MIQKYTKKPVTIEAIQWTEENIPAIKEWLGDNLVSEARYSSPIHWIHKIKTLEGNMVVSEGDYIIKGVKGEFYPCKPEIFEMTYSKQKNQQYKGSYYDVLSEGEINLLREQREKGEMNYYPYYKTETIKWEEGYKFIILYGTGSAFLLKAKEGTTDEEMLENWQAYEISNKL